MVRGSAAGCLQWRVNRTLGWRGRHRLLQMRFVVRIVPVFDFAAGRPLGERSWVAQTTGRLPDTEAPVEERFGSEHRVPLLRDTVAFQAFQPFGRFENGAHNGYGTRHTHLNRTGTPMGVSARSPNRACRRNMSIAAPVDRPWIVAADGLGLIGDHGGAVWHRRATLAGAFDVGEPWNVFIALRDGRRTLPRWRWHPRAKSRCDPFALFDP